MTLQRRILIAFVVVVVVAAAGVLVAQIFTGCWVDVGNEMGDQPAVGYVEPPRSSAPDEAIPFAGPDVPPGEGIPANPVSRTAASEERGFAGYVLFCSPCHGEAAGAPAPGPVGALFEPPPPHLADIVGGLQDGEIFLAVSKGFGRMPALASRMSTEERWHLTNYLRGLVAGEPASAPDSALLRGAQVFSVQCAGCHGPAGEGGLGPRLHPSSLLSEAAPGDVLALLQAGRPARGMPGFGGRLSAQQLDDVVGLLKALQSQGPSALQESLDRLRTSTTGGPPTTPPTTTSPTTGPGTTAAPGPDPAVIELGRKVYAADCAGCHGVDGSGGIGPKLNPNDWIPGVDDAAVRDIVENGRAGTAMPAWSGRLSPEEITAVVALLRDWQDGAGAAAGGAGTTTGTTAAAVSTTTSTTAGSAVTATTASGADPAMIAVGQKVYSGNCAGCHGADGSGGIGPKLKPNAWIGGGTDAAVRDVVENGRAGTAMPNWSGRLSSAEIDAVVALLRSWQGAPTTPPTGTGTTTAPGPGATSTTAPAAGGARASLPFTHRAHVAKGVSCLFCHSSALRGPAADLPPLELCAGCHRWISTQTEATKAVLDAFDTGAEVSWARVYDLPDFVYFSHLPHVAVAKVSCTECHGDVASMTLATRAKRHTMGFCIGCHKRQSERARLIDCQICHK